MASIRLMSSGRFNAQVRKKGHRAQSKTFDNLESAQRWCAEFESGTSIPTTSSQSLLEYGRMYCSRQLFGKPSRHYMLRKFEQIARHFKQPLLAITRADVNEYRLMRLQQVSGPTVREDLQAINKLFRWADREMLFGDIPILSPVRNIAMPPPSKPRSRIIERHELEKLMSALSSVMAEVVELAFETAMRRGEITKLTPKVLRLDERVLSVIDGKTGDRIVPLTRRAVEILRLAQARCYCAESRLFPVAPHSVSTAVRRARIIAGLDDGVRVHQLRHSRITEVARRGFNQAQIMMVSGHRDSRSVQRYTHLNVLDVLALID